MTNKILFLALILSFQIHTSLYAAVESSSNAALEEKETSTGSPLFGAVELSYLPVYLRNYEWEDGIKNETRGTGIKAAFEWMPLGKWPYGKPAVGATLGFFRIQNAVLAPGMTASVNAIPVSPYLVYRADFIENQILVPYAKIGMTYTYIMQKTERTAGTADGIRSALGFDYGFGGELCLNPLDRRSVKNLDTSTGINSVYLLAEYLNTRTVGGNYSNLSAEEFRMGMRFEF